MANGILDFLGTPAGLGLLSGVASYAANARSGTPVNNIGRGLVGGLAGYQGAQQQLRSDEESAFTRQTSRLKMEQIQEEIRRKQAMQEAAAQAAQLANKPAVPAQFDLGGNVGDEGFASMAAEQNQFINEAQGSQLPEQPVQTQEAQPGGFDTEAYRQNMLTQLAQAGLPDEAMKYAPEKAKPIALGKTLVDPATGKTIAVDETWQADQSAQREQRIAELQMRREDTQLNREQQAALRREQDALRRDLARQASADRFAIARMADATRQQKSVPKLPTSALKLQQEELDALSTASSISSDIGALKAQVDSGKLQLGPAKNLIASGRNKAGLSDENSRNYGTFRSTLEKLRNDSLRLNKGVQTEGDAQRVWNELVANINDQELVSRRLGEIQAINERAATIRKMNVDSIRSNFGLDPMDMGQYESQPAIVGGNDSKAKPATVKDLPKKPVAFDDEKERRYQEWKRSQGK